MGRGASVRVVFAWWHRCQRVHVGGQRGSPLLAQSHKESMNNDGRNT
jgi:hypothetical protein